MRPAMTFTNLRPMMSRDATRSLAFSISAVVIAFAIVGCASRSLKTPPQVIDRSTEARSGRPPPVATPNATASVNDNAPVAVTQPIGSESVEQRPLGSPAASSSASLPPASAAPSNAPLKTGPLGLKRPYSDATLAELSKPDAGAGPSIATSPEPAKPQTDAAARIAWAWPASGKIAGTYIDGKSKGIDIAGKSGDAVLAAADGKVIFSNNRVPGYGNFVIVRHSSDLLSVYAHNKTNLVKEDAVVTKGQKIAEMGNTDADSVKLHFEIRQGGKPADPLNFLPER